MYNNFPKKYLQIDFTSDKSWVGFVLVGAGPDDVPSCLIAVVLNIQSSVKSLSKLQWYFNIWP